VAETTVFDGDDNRDLPEGLPGYDLLDEIGRGGLAVVYRARQRNLNRIVAVRTIRGGANSEEVIRLFLWEAEVLTRLQHPHVVTILDRLTHEGQVYLVLEYVNGGTLAKRIAGRPQPPRAAAALIERLALTLGHVHQCEIVHCNLKPRNVLLAAAPNTGSPSGSEALDCEAAYGIPLLSSFALALDRQRPADFKEGIIRGTPAYMAPEQASARHKDISPCTDVYGLGAILYELLTGRPPFQAATAIDLLKLAMEEEPKSIRKLNPGVDRKLEAICHKCLHKDPAKRFAGGLELATELRAYTNGLSKRRWF
jgi:serine/threonine-protein kinase